MSGPEADSGWAGASDLEAMHSPCRDMREVPYLRVTANLGFHSLGKRYPFGFPFERFGGDWMSYRVGPEGAEAWREAAPLLRLEAQYALAPSAHLYLRGDLRRDLRAWHEDPLGLSVPPGAEEVHLNEPSLGYFSWDGDWLSLQLGRFPVHWGPSREHSLALSSGVPYHDGLLIAAKMPRLRYHFILSSLDPWLEGTPPGGNANEDYPEGSEEYRQRNYSTAHNSNPHKRVYDERVKTLAGHRLTLRLPRLELGLTEIQVIGGRQPDFRTANPFAIFHNGFHDGYTNGGVGADMRFSAGWGVDLLGETFLDDLPWSATEGDGATPTLYGFLVGAEHVWTGGSSRLVVPGNWALVQSLTLVRTQPFLYHFFQPYNTLYSRHILSSNYQKDFHGAFVDKFVVDYPLGYLRGGDAVDLWYSASLLVPSRWEAWVRAGWLRRGDKDYYTPFEGYFESDEAPPTGVVEEQFRVEAMGRLDLGWLFGPASVEISGASSGDRAGHVGRQEGSGSGDLSNWGGRPEGSGDTSAARISPGWRLGGSGDTPVARSSWAGLLDGWAIWLGGGYAFIRNEANFEGRTAEPLHLAGGISYIFPR